jgi:hypothetical protein
MDVFESALTAVLLGVTFARQVQTPTDASTRLILFLLSDFKFGVLCCDRV